MRHKLISDNYNFVSTSQPQLKIINSEPHPAFPALNLPALVDMATPSRSSKSGSGGNDRPAKSGLGSFFGGGSKKAGPPPPPKGPPKKAPSPVPMEVDSARATFPFWDGSIPGIASRPAPTKPAYIAWYGTLTGDIWHVAAAQILSEYIRTGQAHPFPAHEIRTCLTIMAEERYGKGTKAAAATSSASRAPAATGSRGQSQEPDGEDADEWGYGEEPPTQSTRVSPCVTRGRKSWRYLQAIRLNASLVMVPHREGSSQVGLANSTLSSGEANMWYVDTPTTFDEAVAARLSHIGGRGAWADGPGVDGDPCLIDLLASTTVVMQMMEYIGYAEAQRILGYRLSGGATLSGTPGESLALRKVDQLCGLIESVDTWLGKKGHKLRGVVLFNYRIGDVNRQHNAGAGILHDVRSVAAEHGYATIVIPQMASSEYARRHKAVITLPGSSSSDRRLDPFMNSFVFDLLDVEPPAAQPQQGQGTSQQAAAAASPFMDDTAKAYFWHLVATYMQGTFSPLGHATGPPPPNFPPQLVQKLKLGLPPVVGLVGGRSGSTDLPGFVGLRVWSWEEPLLEALHGAARPTSSGDWSSRYYTIQGPQATRLFNQQPIIATGWLSMDGFQRNGKDRIYTNLNLEDGYLKRWLGGGANGVPPLPVDANTTFLTVRKPAYLR